MWNSVDKSVIRQVALAFLTGFLLYLPFSKYELWFFVLPAFMLLFRIRFGLYWLLSGFVFFFLSLRCANIASVDYGGVSPVLSYGLFSFFAFFLSLYQFYLPFWLWKRLFRDNVWFLPLLYGSFEVIRSHFPYGGFPWLIMGSLSVYLPLVKHSLLYANVYLQSLFLLYTVLFILYRKVKLISLAWTLFLLMGFLALKEKNRVMEKAQLIKVALVQTAVPQEDKLQRESFRKHAREILKLIEEANKKGVDLVVLPESAFHFFYSEESDEANFELRLLSQKTPILVGLVDIREGLKPYNSAYLLKDGIAVQRYDKIRLFPIGEYMPFPFGFLKELFPAISGLDYFPGESLKPLEYGNMKIATPICFEVAYYGLVRDLSKGANLMAVLTNDGWFKDSDCVSQHYLWARVRALETGKYVLWVNNSGDTGIIDPMGMVLERMPYMKRGVVYGEVLLIN
ncbi:MAG: apolipoprotein N-acyltransferase [Aquificaceae bacterium]